MDEQILNQRNSKNIYLRTNPNSPIPRWARKKFKGLIYFDYNNELIFKANIQLIKSSDEIKIANNMGTHQLYKKTALLNFVFNNLSYQLSVFQDLENKNILWLPFKDKTNGFESYYAGRYLNIKPEDLEKNFFILNFNASYNPFCAYNENYACPLIPKENHLDISILAGEKFSQRLW